MLNGGFGCGGCGGVGGGGVSRSFFNSWFYIVIHCYVVFFQCAWWMVIVAWI